MFHYPQHPDPRAVTPDHLFSTSAMSQRVPPTLDVGALYERHGGVVYRRILQFYPRQQAEEILQEVFVRVLATQHQFRGDSHPATWLYQLTTRHCLNRRRNERRRRELLGCYGDPSWACPVTPASQETVAFLEQIWRELDEETLEIAVYTYRDGLSQADIAELMGISRRTVGNRLTALTERARAAAGLEGA
ncbi:MAG: sigma-70 family RNA polymerase sigma factor [Deltaproteobacteria bacterium]|nr:MAG: sigma-70 family RNA polymerase sigma factor [Deltaproteobacteria bacterium]